MVDNIDDLVTDYLLGNMDPTARNRFEQRMAAEPELAARVALEQEVAETMDSSTAENQLRANLRQIAAKYQSLESLTPAAEKGKGIQTRNGWLLLGISLAVLGLWGYWQLSLKAKAPAIPVPESTQESPIIKSEDIQKVEHQAQTKPQPIAANYKPIPTLESYIGSQRRSGDFQLHLDEPKSGATLIRAANRLQFRLSGRVEGTIPGGSGFILLVFNNNLKNFEDLRTVESQPLEIKADGTFQFQKQWALQSGLYYLVIEDKSSGEWLMVDKFLVKD